MGEEHGGVRHPPGLDKSGPTTKNNSNGRPIQRLGTMTVKVRITAVESLPGYVPTRIYEHRRGDGIYSVDDEPRGRC